MAPSRSVVDDCAFCRISRGEDKSVEIVHGDANWLAFFPLNPATPGHTLVIPRVHVADLWQVEPPTDAELMAAVIKVGRAIDAAVQRDRVDFGVAAPDAWGCG